MRLAYRHGPLSLVATALLACGPKEPGTTDTTTAGATTDGTTTVTTTAPTTGPMNEPVQTPPSSGEQLCIDFCSNLIARDADCSRADYTCYEWCQLGFEVADTCQAELRAARRCEAEATAFDDVWACEAPECASVYAAAAVCQGYCSHLGGNPSSGSSNALCEYGSDCADSHTYEMQCATGDAPVCSCWIDDTKAGECQLAVGLESFACGAIDLFGGCCNELFLPVLQPAAVEPLPSEPEVGGTAAPGDPCSLVGLFLACDQGGGAGRVFCDDVGGSMQFGPCITDQDCELMALACDGSCQLLEGVPTWVAEDCVEETSSG